MRWIGASPGGRVASPQVSRHPPAALSLTENPVNLPVGERIVARLRRLEDGSLSNQKVEQYAILLAENVVNKTAAISMTLATKGGNKPSSGYLANIHKSPAFKARLEELMEERAQLEVGGVWGRLEWQARQIYRKACAMNDLQGMQRATDTLYKIATRTDKPERPADPANDGETVHRGPGAPAVEAPVEEPDSIKARLIAR